MTEVWKYVSEQIDHLEMQGTEFRANVLPEWTRMLKGIPKQAEKDFPFPNASNLVVQLIATRVEQLLSRAMVMYDVEPLWNISSTGDVVGQESESQARVLEEFLGDMAVDPEELNLYRKEEVHYHDGIAYGTSFLFLPWQYITEQQSVDLGDGLSSAEPRHIEFKTYIKKDGPSPENIPIERVLIDNKTPDLEKARFVVKKLILTREAVEDRIAFGIWSKEDGEAVLRCPDSEEEYNKKSQAMDKNIQQSGNIYDEVYVVHECYFKFVHDRKTFSLIAHYHAATKTKLSIVFNFFPKNMLPMEDFRFGYDSDSYYGYGFCEMLQGYQREVSMLHNNRLDNEAIRNNVSFRIDKDSELASTLKFYPGVGIPANENEIEVLDTKVGPSDNLQSETASISLTNERSGIDPAITGNGSGIVNNKRGIYSSQGTLAVLQQQNNRTGMRMMDIRSTHVKIGRKICDLYAFFGIGGRLARYGQEAATLHKALDAVKNGSLGLVMKPTGGSNNSDVDRQNSILLEGLQTRYIQTVSQIIMQLEQPQTDPKMAEYLVSALFAQHSLTRDLFRVFGKFNVDTLLPFPKWIKDARFAQEAAGNTRSPQAVPNTVPGGNSIQPNNVPSATPGDPSQAINNSGAAQ